MRIGIYYGMDLGAGASGEGMYGEIAEQIKLADERGIDTAWIAESHFAEGSCPSPQIMIPALGSITEAIRIGPLKILPLDHQPMRIAEDFGQIDIELNGRLNFGVWEGNDPEAFRAHNQSMKERWGRFQEVLDFILVAWTNDSIAYVGEHVKFPGNAKPPANGARWERAPFTPPYKPQWEWGDWVPPHLAVTPKPVQTPHPPVYVYGWRDQAIDFAARHGNSFIFSHLESLPRIREKVARYTRELEAAGRSTTDVDIAIVRDVWVHQDAGAARAQAEPVLERAFRRASEDGSLAEAEGKSFSSAELSYDDLARDRFLIGEPKAVVDQIKTLQAETGINHLICRIPFPGVTNTQVKAFINTFERYVHPMLFV